jgi:hypothetical protein
MYTAPDPTFNSGDDLMTADDLMIWINATSAKVPEGKRIASQNAFVKLVKGHDSISRSLATCQSFSKKGSGLTEEERKNLLSSRQNFLD